MNEEETNATVVTAASKVVAKEKSPNILVIDDDQVLLDLLGKVLRKFGFRVVLIDNGKDAVNLVRRTTPDVVLLDIKMPGMDGIAVLKEIKAFDPDIEVIIMTGFASLHTSVEALRYEAFDYIQKPFNRLDQVVDVIRQAWERRRPRLEGRSKEASLEKRIYELKVLYQLSRILSNCSDGKEMMIQLLNSLSRIIRYDIAISLWTERSEQIKLLLQVVNPSNSSFIQEAKCNLIDAFNSVSQSKRCKDVAFDRILGEENIKQESQIDLRTAEKLNSLLNVPLMYEKEVMGMINVGSRYDRSFGPDDICLIYSAISLISPSLHRISGVKVAERSNIEELVQSISDGVIMIDENFEVTLVSPVAQKILGEENPNLESIQNLLDIDLKKIKTEADKKISDLIRKKTKIQSESYEIITSIIKGTAGAFLGFVISIRKCTKEDRIDSK